MATREEVPIGGFTVQKTAANKAKWLIEAKSEYKAYCTLNDKALGVIYNLCDKHTQTIIASETTAKGAWDRLSEAYKQQGFSAIFEQVSLMNTYTYRGCNSLEEYVNKIKNNRATLEALGQSFNDDVWSCIFIKGLGESFDILTSQLLAVEKGKRSFDEVIQLTFTEELRMKNNNTSGAIFKSQGQSNKSKGNNKSTKDKDSDKDQDTEKPIFCRTHNSTTHS